MKLFYLKWWRLVLCMTVIMLGFVCPAEAKRPLSVYVVNYPLKYFAERIGGPHVKVTLPVPSDQDPVYWTPGIADIVEYQQADLILLNGAGYAKWVSKVSLPRSKTVDTSRGFKDQYITVKETMTHSHGAEGEHAHEGLAFTIWLDFDLAVLQSKAIAKAFSRNNPELKEEYEQRWRALKADLDKLSDAMHAMTAQAIDHPLIASHPVYDYLTRRFRLNMASVHWEPNETPTTKQWLELQDLMKSHPAQWMVWEGEPLSEIVQELKSLGMRSLVFDPCGNVPETGDFLSVMQQSIENFKPVFQ